MYCYRSCSPSPSSRRTIGFPPTDNCSLVKALDLELQLEAASSRISPLRADPLADRHHKITMRNRVRLTNLAQIHSRPLLRQGIMTTLVALFSLAPIGTSLAAQQQSQQPDSSQQKPAQQPVEDLSKLNLEDLMNIPVYSASKRTQSSSDAPSSVTVITANEIQKYGYRSLADILESVRGFYVTYDRDYSFVGVRGFGRLGDSNNRLLVLIDGHRINDNVFGQPYLGTEFLVDVDMIERVEIIRGPSSSLYGADAFFAVINVITRKSQQLKGTELSFSGASYDTFQGRASYGARFHDLDLALSGTFYNSQGPTLFFPEFNSPATNNGITPSTDYENFQHIIGTVSLHGFTLQGLRSEERR